MDNLNWFKSSFSNPQGACVEVAFKKSSFSAQNGGCVEVSRPSANQILVRDTKDRSLTPHVYTDVEWDAFIKGAKAGEFDLPA